MELDELIKKRDAYAGKILKLGIIIAVIFLLPAIIALFLHYYFGISYVYLLGGAFIISWAGVIIFYRKIHREVKSLELQIKKLHEGQGQTQKDTL